MLVDPRRYTMQDLVEQTGFNPRTIRLYISKGLVPRAGMNQRGPKATYGYETLWKLQKIAELKDQPYGPSNRTRTLEEIRHEVQLRWLREGSGVELMQESPAILCEALECSPPPMIRDRHQERRIDFLRRRTNTRKNQPEIAFPGQESDFAESLLELKKLLLELAGSTSGANRDAGESWRRIGTPDIEFHVRVPEDDRARARLLRIAEILEDLMTGGS